MSEALQSEGNGHSRRALLAGVTGGGAAFAASALARPEQAKAGTDGDVVLGGQNTATQATVIQTTNTIPALSVQSQATALLTQGLASSTGDPNAAAISASHASASAVEPAIFAGALGSTTAILGRARRVLPNQVATGNGVEGSADGGAGVRGTSASGNGTEGISSGASAAGVSGDNQDGGYGAVGGTTSATNAGVWGNNYGSGAGARPPAAAATGYRPGRKRRSRRRHRRHRRFFTSTGPDGVFGQGAATGVHGFCQGANGAGVLGVASSGAGVKGTTSFAATAGVAAENTGGGSALKVTGKAAFNRSGIATIAGTTGTPKNSVVVTVPGAALSAASMVLATIQGNPAGVYLQGVVKGTTSFTIFLNKAVTTNVKVGWFIIN